MTKKLSYNLSKFCRQFGINGVRYDYLKTWYDFNKKIIYYNLYIDDDYVNHIKKVYDIDISDIKNNLIFGILHEIGHHLTVEHDEEELYMRQVLYECALKGKTFKYVTLDDIYFALPSEIRANNWAAEHYIKYKTELLSILDNALESIYI